MGKLAQRFFVFVSALVILLGNGFASNSNAEPPALARLSGAEKERVQKLIAGAKKEGEIVAYSASWRPDVQAKMIPQFLQEYGLSDAELKVKIISTRTGAIVTKITEELRAKVYKTDVVNTAPTYWFDELIAKKEVMPYNSPEYKHFSPLAADPKIGAANPPYYISGILSPYGLAYNPQYIKEEILHWKDVLRPEYKGKICCGDVSKSFSYTEAYLAIRSVVGRGFFEELGKQKPFVLVAATDLVNKCVSGEYPIIVISSQNVVFRANEKGAGLKNIFPPEGWAAIGYPAAILGHAPHPNAAKLFMDYLHGEPGQSLCLNFGGDVIGRLGIKSNYDFFPKPVSEIKGAIPMNWNKLTIQDRDAAREEFRKLVIGE